jgi:SAM-dependent methyltransferase
MSDFFSGVIYRPCPVCGFMLDGYHIHGSLGYVKCDNCGIIYNMTPLNRDEYYAYTDDGVLYTELTDKYIINEKEHISKALKLTSRINSLVPSPWKNVLVIGSGVGFILDAMSPYSNHKPIGIESSYKKLDVSIHMEHHHDAFHVLVEDLPFQNCFDLVFARNILSWVDNPLYIIGKMISSVCNGGNLVIYTRLYNPESVDQIYRLLWDESTIGSICSKFFRQINIRTYDGSDVFVVIQNKLNI